MAIGGGHGNIRVRVGIHMQSLCFLLEKIIKKKKEKQKKKKKKKQKNPINPHRIHPKIILHFKSHPSGTTNLNRKRKTRPIKPSNLVSRERISAHFGGGKRGREIGEGGRDSEVSGKERRLLFSLFCVFCCKP